MSGTSGESGHFIFHGTILKRDDTYVTVRLFPGLVLDVRTQDIEEIEEAEDEVTQRAYVRVRLKPDAEISANFKPRLARLALAAQGVPFAFGGTDKESMPHALPSGGAASLPPVLDPRGLAVFARSLPPETWGALAALAGSAQLAGTKTTTYTTESQTFERNTNLGVTNYQTLIPGDVPRTQPDNEQDWVQDFKTDETQDTKQDPTW
jgi:hypothetical protein